MQELMEKLKQRPQTAAEVLDERKAAWLSSLSSLHSQVERWLAPMSNAGLLKLTFSEVEIEDQELGEYTAPVLTLSDGRQSVRLEPVGLHVVGVVAGGRRHTGFQGRVDIISGASRIPLLRTTDDQWQVVWRAAEPARFDEGSFSRILSELLLDE